MFKPPNFIYVCVCVCVYKHIISNYYINYWGCRGDLEKKPKTKKQHIASGDVTTPTHNPSIGEAGGSYGIQGQPRL